MGQFRYGTVIFLTKSGQRTTKTVSFGAVSVPNRFCVFWIDFDTFEQVYREFGSLGIGIGALF